jgi:hypothetical protein
MYKVMQGMTNIHMLTRDRLSPDLYPVDYYLVTSGIWAPSGIRLPSGIRHLVLGKPPPGATSSGKDQCYFKK